MSVGATVTFVAPSAGVSAVGTAGAAMVVVIALLARTRSFYVAGLVPLFPTFGLVAHVIVATERSVADLRKTIVFGAWGLAPYCAYLGTLYVLAGRVRLGWALVGSLAAWGVAATVLVLAWNRA